VGTLDEAGFIRLTDRAKDVIKSGGEWISSMELENLLMAHPSVAEAAVIGVPDEQWGETVKAIVVLAAGQQLDEAAIIEHCRSRLAHYKCPTSVGAIDVLPRNPSGKILKRELRAPYWAGRSRAIN
jgi:acyl-CoA synthetase (AMP-forming)/AMP-acid ligase II